MMCFKDKTFCTAECDLSVECDLRYTPQVYADAKEWWGKEGAPIAVGDRSSSCSIFKPTEEVKK